MPASSTCASEPPVDLCTAGAQPGVVTTCRAMLDAVDRMRAIDPVLLRRTWKQLMDGAGTDWVIAVRDNQTLVRELFTLCGEKARRGPPEASPPGPGSVH